MKTEFDFGELLHDYIRKAVRQNPEYTIQRFSKRLGITPVFLSGWQNGTLLPNENDVEKISDDLQLITADRKKLLCSYKEAIADSEKYIAEHKRKIEERVPAVAFLDFADGSGTCLVGNENRTAKNLRDFSISKLTYTERTWPNSRIKLVIESTSRKVVIDDAEERRIYKCTNAEWCKLQILLIDSNFPIWQKEYYEPVLDGTSWTLEIQNDDGTILNSTGTNGYPAEWEKFHALLQFCDDLFTDME